MSVDSVATISDLRVENRTNRLAFIYDNKALNLIGKTHITNNNLDVEKEVIT
jgi:hypothetical protein